MDTFFDYCLGDLECDGFNPSTIFMVGIVNLVTGEYRDFIGPDQVGEACYNLATKSKMIVGHYFAGFDTKIIKKITTLEIPSEIIVDTVDASRCFMPLFENHKLKRWGEFFGDPKLEQPRFDKFSPEMVPYCKQDVMLNKRAFDHMFELAAEQNRLSSIHPNVDLLMEYAALRYP